MNVNKDWNKIGSETFKNAEFCHSGSDWGTPHNVLETLSGCFGMVTRGNPQRVFVARPQYYQYITALSKDGVRFALEMLLKDTEIILDDTLEGGTAYAEFYGIGCSITGI